MWRQPEPSELDLVRKLLSADFEGVSALILQLDKCSLVRTLDEEGSFKFDIPKMCAKAVVKGRVPVEAEYADDPSNNVPLKPKVRLLLHVIGGYLDELEIYKDDGTSILRPAKPEDLSLFYREICK